MKIGFDKKIITPKNTVELGGYGVQRKSEGILDEIYVRTLVCSFGGEIFGIVNVDLVAVDKLIIGKIHSFLTSKNLNINNFIISATHTHSSVGGTLNTSEGLLAFTYDFFKKENIKLVDEISTTINESIMSSIEKISECEVSYITGHIHDVGCNRNNKKLVGDNSINILEINSFDFGKVLLINYACHPTILNSKNKLISADLPGILNERLSKDGYYYCMYLNGPSGDISTRFNRQLEGVEELNRIGDIFYFQVSNLLKNTKKVEVTSINNSNFKIRLKFKSYNNINNTEDKLNYYKNLYLNAIEKKVDNNDLRLIESYIEGANVEKNMINFLSDKDYIDVNFSMYEINGFKFIIIPGEIFSELTNEVKSDNIKFITCTNGYIGYLADKYAYENNYYEAQTSLFEKGESEKIINYINKLF